MVNRLDRIFLIGFMGSGKSTLGRKLAKLLGYELIDLDKLIELEVGMSILDYFEQYGEGAFRRLERDLLQNINHPKKVVFATGGGTPCYFDTMDWMNKNGITIYIALKVPVLANRLRNAKIDRPLIKNMQEGELTEFLTKNLAEREVFYNKAKFIVSGIDLTAEKLAHYLHMIN